MTDDKLLTYDEVAAWLNLPRGTLSSLVHRNAIPYIRLGPRIVRFSRAALEAWLEERSRPHPVIAYPPKHGSQYAKAAARVALSALGTARGRGGVG